MPRTRTNRLDLKLSDDEIASFNEYMQDSKSKSKIEAFLKLLKEPKKRAKQKKEFTNKLKEKDRRIGELKNQPQSQPKIEYKEVVKEVPKIEYRDRIVEKPVVVEVPVEKPIVVFEENWLPEYWPFSNQREYEEWLNN